MSVPKYAKIPEGFIEEALEYWIMPIDAQYGAVKVGGKIMFKMVVLDQMRVENIIYTTGLSKQVCTIGVSYTFQEIMIMVGNAKRLAGRLIEEGGGLGGN